MVDTRTLRDFIGSLPFGSPSVFVGSDLTLGSSSEAQLRADLANSVDADKGAALVSNNITLSYPDGSLGKRLADVGSIVDRQTQNIVYNGTAFQPSKTFSYWAGGASGTVTGGVHLALVDIGSNQINAPSTGLVRGFSVNHNFGGGNARGGFTGTYAVINQVGPTQNVGNQGYYVADLAVAQSAHNDTGTELLPSGHIFSGNDNVRLLAGATWWDQIVGREINIAVHAGVTVRDVVGLQIVRTDVHVQRGSHSNTAIVIADQLDAAVTGAGWDIGISFGARQGLNAMAPTSTLICGDYNSDLSARYNVASGVDLSKFNFTDYAFRSVRWAINGLGDMLSYRTDEQTNFERGYLRWNGSNFELGTEKGGTGASRALTLKSATGGVLLLDAAGTDFGALQFGGISASFPSLRRFGQKLLSKLSDNSAYAQVDMLRLGIVDGATAPAAVAGIAQVWVDSTDGDFKIIFGDGTVKTIVTDT